MIILKPAFPDLYKPAGRRKERPADRQIPMYINRAGISVFGITLGGAAVFYCRETRKLPQVNSI